MHTLHMISKTALGAFLMTTAMMVQAATVAYYRFESHHAGSLAQKEGSIVDSSGNGLDGSPFDQPVYKRVQGVPDSRRALAFNGDTSRIAVPDSPLLALTHGLTLEAYVFSRSQGEGWAYIVFRGDDRSGMDPYFLNTMTGHLAFRITDASGAVSDVRDPDPLPLETWLHVAGSLDDATGTQSLYVNGTLVATQHTDLRPFGPLEANAKPGVGIGNTQSEGWHQGWHGKIDEVRISDVALAPGDMLPQPLDGGDMPSPPWTRRSARIDTLNTKDPAP